MFDVIVVSLKTTKGLVFASCEDDLDLKVGDVVLTETDCGPQLGTVKRVNYQVKEENLDLPLKKIIRLATSDDFTQFDKNINDAEKALAVARKFVTELDLDMNFVEAFYNFDRTQLVLSFLADDRIDFRELAKKLAQKYKTRIELRQIGVRDKSKKIGGFGPCGLFLCCNSFLTDFSSVSINMAKNQFLALNPSKINGSCGRLLCCLGYENDLYTELKKDLPKMGAIMETEAGTGKVVAVDVFKKTYSVDLNEKGIIEFSKDSKHVSNK